MTERYPPAPWRLHGQMYGVYLRMPPGSVPEALTPNNIPLKRRDGAMVLAAYFIDYQEGGLLTYREFLVTAIGKLRMPIRGTILRIWVDSDAALFGGRELWHIPKEMGEFEFEHGAAFTGSLSLDGKEAASYRFTPKRTVPGRWPFSSWLTQESATGLRGTFSRFRARFQFGSGELTVPDTSDLSFLNEGRPIAHIAMRDFTARFGLRSVDVPAPSAQRATRG